MHWVWIASYPTAWLIVIAQFLLVMATLSALGRIELHRDARVYPLLTADDGPELHMGIVQFEGRDLHGRVVRSEDLRGREFLLLILGRECPPCDDLARIIRPTYLGLRRPPVFLLVIEAHPMQARSYTQRHRLDCTVLADQNGHIRAGLGVQRIPFGLLIDSEGVVRMKGVVNDRWQLEALIDRRGQRVGAADWSVTGPDTVAPAT